MPELLLRLIPAPRPPEGLGGPVGELPVLGGSLIGAQRRAAALAGLRWVEPGTPLPEDQPRLLLREDALPWWVALAELGREGQRQDRDLRFALGGRAGELCAELRLGRPEPPVLTYLRPGGAALPERLQAAPEQVFDPRERLLPSPIPVEEGQEAVSLPLSDLLVMPVGHWLQLLWANLLLLPAFLWRELVGPSPLVMAARGAWAAFLAGSADPWALAGPLSRMGKGARVHPSAVVEGCWLGEGAQIGANAVVRGCVLGAGAVVEELAIVEACAIGPGARVQRKGFCKYSVLQAGAIVAGSCQMAVFDRRAELKRYSALFDQSFVGPVSVSVGGERVQVPFGLAGCCVGQGTRIAANVFVAPGRCLPPGLSILPAPEQVLRSIPEGIGGAVVVRNGRLEPA